MKAAIEVLLTSRPLERVESDIAVAGFFADDRPLRSGAARADWRLCAHQHAAVVLGGFIPL